MNEMAVTRGGDFGGYLDSALSVVDLPLEPELRPRVLMHFEIAAQMAELVLAFALADEAEPAPVFVP